MKLLFKDSFRCFGHLHAEKKRKENVADEKIKFPKNDFFVNLIQSSNRFFSQKWLLTTFVEIQLQLKNETRLK